MSEFEQPRGYDLDEGRERSTGPGPGQPTGETLPGDSEPTGVEELRKRDVGFGAEEDSESEGGAAA